MFVLYDTLYLNEAHKLIFSILVSDKEILLAKFHGILVRAGEKWCGAGTLLLASRLTA